MKPRIRGRTSPSAFNSNSSSNNNNPPPLSKETVAAYTELCKIVEVTRSSENSPHNAITEQAEDRVLQILQSFPVLASRGLVINVSLKNFYLPLSFLVENNARLETVRQVYILHKDAVFYKDRWGNTPLHFACQTRADPQLIQFLLQECPRTLSMPNKVGDLPLHCIIKGKSSQSRDITKESLDLLLPPPQAALLVQQENDLNLNPLQLALKKYHIDADILEYLFEKVACRVQIFSLTTKLEDDSLKLKHAKAMAKVLPYVTSFRCSPDRLPGGWTLEAFQHLISAIQNSPNAVNVHLKLPRDLLASEPTARHTLKELMQGYGSSLKTLKLAFYESTTTGYYYYDDECIEALAQGMEARNQSSDNNNNNNNDHNNKQGLLERMMIKDCSLSSTHALTNLLRQAPKMLGLDNLQIHSPVIEFPSVSFEDVLCETLDLRMPLSNWYFDFLDVLWTMPRLTQVIIDTTSSTTTTMVAAASDSEQINITEPVLKLLAQGKITTLNVCCQPFFVDPKAILDVLETSNTTLQEYEHWTLNGYYQEGTLYEHLDDDYGNSIARKIRYFTLLNAHGRALARNTSTTNTNNGNTNTKLDFVELLIRNQTLDVEFLYRNRMPGNNSWWNTLDLDQVNILFGLLTECPELWSKD